jgi:anthranilate phosphoribosyltransferase
MAEHPLAEYVRILGRGRKATRSLTYEESLEAMRMILSGDVEDVQLGAFLMLLRIKEESHEELAGFAQAVRNTLPKLDSPLAKLDWPSYAGKRENLSHYILSMILLSENGISVLTHGSPGHTEKRLYTELVFEKLNLNMASSIENASTLLKTNNLVYLPLDKLCSPLNKIMNMRHLFGLRSPVHSFAKLINPGRCEAMIIPTFHPSYKAVHQQAALLLEENNVAIFKGDSGEAERRPHAILSVDCVKSGEACIEKWPALCEKIDGKAVPDIEALIDLWRGTSNKSISLAYSEQAIIGTAALALRTTGSSVTQESALKQAKAMWQDRNKQLF